MNILKIKLIRALFSSSTYPIIAQVLLFFAFSALIYGGIVIIEIHMALLEQGKLVDIPYCQSSVPLDQIRLDRIQ